MCRVSHHLARPDCCWCSDGQAAGTMAQQTACRVGRANQNTSTGQSTHQLGAFMQTANAGELHVTGVSCHHARHHERHACHSHSGLHVQYPLLHVMSAPGLNYGPSRATLRRLTLHCHCGCTSCCGPPQLRATLLLVTAPDRPRPTTQQQLPVASAVSAALQAIGEHKGEFAVVTWWCQVVLYSCTDGKAPAVGLQV